MGIKQDPADMDSMTQVVATLYVALAEAAGGAPALATANAVIRDAIRDRAVDDPLAIEMLSALADDGAGAFATPGLETFCNVRDAAQLRATA